MPAACARIAQSLGAVLVKNVVALGALQEAAQILEAGSFLTVLERSLKKKPALMPLNREAFERGVKAVREGAGSQTCWSPRVRRARNRLDPSRN